MQKKSYSAIILWTVIVALFQGCGASSVTLVLPSVPGNAEQALGLADSQGNLTWITTVTDTILLNMLYTETSAAIPLTLVLRDTTASFAVNNLTLTGTESITGNLLVTGSIVGSVFYEYPATTAVDRTIQNKLNDYIDITDFGAVGDGITNNFVAFQQAFAYLTSKGGGQLYIPSGTYVLNYSGSSALNFPTNTTITGDGSSNTILNLSATPSTVVFFRNSVSNVTVQHLSLVINPSSLGSSQAVGIIAINPTCNNFILFDVAFNGNMTNTGSTLSYIAHGIEFPSAGGTQSNIMINQCLFHNLDFSLLKSNTATSTQKQVSILTCTFSNNYAADISFNSPLGSQSNILIQGNTLINNLAYALGQKGLGVSIASGKDIIISDNYISGAYFNGGIHLENNISDFVVQNNFITTMSGTGIIVLANIFGDPSYVMPQNGIIQDNIINFSGPSAIPGSVGLNLSYDTHPSPAQNVIVADNIITGNWSVGFQDGCYVPSMALVKGNQVNGAAIGFYFIQGGLYCDSNISTSCVIGLQGRNASVNRHFFHDCLTTVSSTNQPLMILNPVVEFDAQTISPGQNIFNLLPLGINDRLSARGAIYVRNNNANQLAADLVNVSWDGITFSTAPLMTSQPQGNFIATFTLNNNMLALQVTSTIATTTVALEVSLNGMYALSFMQ